MFTVTSSLVPTSSAANCPSLVQVSAGSQHPYAPIHPHHHPTHHVQLANPMHHHHIHHLNSANVAALIAAGHHVAHHPMSNSSEFGSLGLNGTPGGMASNGWHQYSAIDPYAMKQAQGAQQQYADYHLLMSTFAAPPPPPPNANSSYSQCNNSNNRTLNNGNCTSNSHYSHSPYSSMALDKHSNSNGQPQQPNGTHHQHHNQYVSGNISAEPTARLGTKESSATVTADSGTLVSSATSLTCSNSSTSNSSALTSSSSSSLSSPLSSLSPATGVTAPCTTSSSTAIANKSMSPPVASSNSLISSYCPLPMATSTSAVVTSPAIPALIPASSNSTCTATANYIAHPVQQHSNAHSTLSSGAPTSAAVNNNNNNNHSNSQQLASSSSSSSSTSNYYQPIKDTTFTKIFVGGLPYHTTDKSLRAFFETFGELEEAVVITDRQTGKSRGYGFVTMADRDSAERAVKEANPIIDGRKANVNLAYLGAKPRNGYLPNGYPFSSLSRSSATASTATGAYATFPSSNATAAAFGPGSQFGFAAQPHIVYHPGSASLAGNSATSPPGTFLPPATPTGLILTPPGAFYADYGLGPGSGTNTNPFAAAAASGYADATILTPFLTPTFAPSSSIVATSTAGHHHQQHYSNGTGGHHSSQQAIAAAAAAALVGMTPSASVSSTVGSPATQSNSSAASAAAATAAAAAFYLNGPTTNGFLTGAYLTDTRI